MNISRRTALKGALYTAAAFSLPAGARAQGADIVLGTLTPITGAGGTYGPRMRDAAIAVVAKVNADGGVLGRTVKLVSEDDQTSPEAGVRAARKLIDVDKASAIIGTWASAVTMAVAPLCWETRTFLVTMSSADPITQLPHQGYLIRTQPNNVVAGEGYGRVALELGAKKLVFMGPESPFARPMAASMHNILAAQGGSVEATIYDGTKTSFRSEVDATLRMKPDTIFLGGFPADTSIILKELYRFGYDGRIICIGYGLTPAAIAELPPEVVNGTYTTGVAADTGSSGYKKALEIIGTPEIDVYTAGIYDQMNLTLLAIEAAGGSTGTDIRDTIRQVAQGEGPEVDNLADGLKQIRAGNKKLQYVGACGRYNFNEAGDVTSFQFGVSQVIDHKLVFQKVL